MVADDSGQLDAEYDLDFALARRAEFLALLDWLEAAIREFESFPPRYSDKDPMYWLREEIAAVFAGHERPKPKGPTPSAQTASRLLWICRDSIEAELRARASVNFRFSGSANRTLRILEQLKGPVIEDAFHRVWQPNMAKLLNLYSLEPKIEAFFKSMWMDLPAQVAEFVSGELAMELVWPLADADRSVKPVESTKQPTRETISLRSSTVQSVAFDPGKEFRVKAIAKLAGVCDRTVNSYRSQDPKLPKETRDAVADAIQSLRREKARPKVGDDLELVARASGSL
jgi:hypothetical protein